MSLETFPKELNFEEFVLLGNAGRETRRSKRTNNTLSIVFKNSNRAELQASQVNDYSGGKLIWSLSALGSELLNNTNYVP